MGLPVAGNACARLAPLPNQVRIALRTPFAPLQHVPIALDHVRDALVAATWRDHRNEEGRPTREAQDTVRPIHSEPLQAHDRG